MRDQRAIIILLLAAACGPNGRGGGGGGGDNVDAPGNTGDSGQSGCGGLANCYSVYAHSDDTLYVVDLNAKTLMTVGKFNTPGGYAITDLAVAPDNPIYVISEKGLYTASATDGHVTSIGSVTACGTQAVALTTTPNGQIWTGDFMGSLCQIDVSTSPPTVMTPVTMQDNMALSGDLVAIDDGTIFGTAYNLSDNSGQGTQNSNVLVKVDLATGAVTMVGATGYPKLFGTSFAAGGVIGFTHDGTGHVVKIDPTTGVGEMFATFNDPDTNQGISFAGAGVNSLVSIIE